MENSTANALDVNLCACPSGNRAFIVEPIAGDAVMDITCPSYRAQRCFSRKSQKYQQTSKLRLLHPSIPLTIVNSSYEAKEHFVQSTIVCPSYERFRVNCTKQSKRFHREHNATQFQGLLRSVKDDPDLYRTVKGVVVKYLDDSSMYETLEDNAKELRNNSSELSSIVSRFLTDIPNTLLLETLNESCFQDFDDLKTNWNLRNSMLTLKNGQQTFVVYACGGEVIALRLMYPTSNTDGAEEIRKTADGEENLVTYEECGKINIGFSVNELCHVEGLIVARTDYGCFFMTFDFSNSDLLLKYDVRFDTRVMGAAVNPSRSHQFVVVSEESTVALFQDGHLVRKVNTRGTGCSLPWQNIVYGNFSQTSLVSNQHDITMYDFREPVAKAKTFFELPTEYLNRYDEISPVLCRNPMNAYQYFFTTNQTVVIFDERYLKTPVMAINHYMKSPPRFAQKQISKTAANVNNLLLAIGSYQDGEIVGLNFTNDNSVEEMFLNKFKVSCRNQVALDGPIIKFWRHNEWLKYTNDWKTSLKEVIQRLSCPLIGISVCSITNNRNVMLQLTDSGDMFYQEFMYETDDTDEKSRTNDGLNFCTESDKLVEFQADYKNRCEAWLKDCLKIHHQIDGPSKNRDNNSEEILHLQIDSFEKNLIGTRFSRCAADSENATETSEETTPITDRHQPAKYKVENNSESSIACGETKDENHGSTYHQAENTSNVEFTDNCWRKMETLKSKNEIITRSSLGCTLSVAKQPDLVRNMDEYTKPLSRVLSTNWYSDNYVFLETFAPNASTGLPYISS